MEPSTLKLLAIVADDALEKVLEEILTTFGATGYTLTRVEGKGKTGARNNSWEGENIKVEVITSMQVLEKVIQHIKEKFFDRYPIIVYYHDVDVIRTSHFIQKEK